jgi:hypothetical protein
MSRDILQETHAIWSDANTRCLRECHCFCGKPRPGPYILLYAENQIQTDRETKVFNKFAAKSKNKRSHQDDDSPNDSEELYNIDEEIELLKEVKDIQDELHILLVLLETQSAVLEQAAEAMTKRGEFQDSTPKSPLSHAGTIGSTRQGQEAPYRSTFHFKKLHQLVLDQEKRRETLQVQAGAANKAVSIPL